MATEPWIYSSDNISDRRQRDGAPRKRLRPSDVLIRAAVCEITRTETRPNQFESIANVIKGRYDGCPATEFFIRAATNPAATTTVNWAAELVGQSTLDFIATDARASGFAQLAQRALTVTLDGVGSVKVPTRSSPLSLMGTWIAEGGPKPVFAGALTATTLQSYKLSAIFTFTEEMTNSSAIERIMREVLVHDLSALLDSAIFDAAAVSAVRPAGLFNGATAVTASSTTPQNEAMVADLRALAAAVAGTGNPDAAATTLFVVNPQQAIRVNLMAPGYANLIVSGYMVPGNVGAIDSGSVAMLVGQPQFAVTTDASLHMETSPLPLGTGVQGSGVLATPLTSLFQQDAVGLRCVMRCGWVKRRATATALASAVTW